MDRPPGYDGLSASYKPQVSPPGGGGAIHLQSPAHSARSARPAPSDTFKQQVQSQSMPDNLQHTELHAQNFYSVPSLGAVPRGRQLQPGIYAPSNMESQHTMKNEAGLTTPNSQSFAQPQYRGGSAAPGVPRVGSGSLVIYHNNPSTPYQGTPHGGAIKDLRATASDFFPTPVQGFGNYTSFRENAPESISAPIGASPYGLANLQTLQRLPIIPHSPSFAAFGSPLTPFGISGLGVNAGSGHHYQTSTSPVSNVGTDVRTSSSPSQAVTKRLAQTQPSLSREFTSYSGESTPRRFIQPVVPFENQLSGERRLGPDHRPFHNNNAPSAAVSNLSPHAPINAGDTIAALVEVAAEAQSGPSTAPMTVAVSQPKLKARNPKPPIFGEKKHCNSFKVRKLNNEWFEEPFEGAFDKLGPLNPDHFQMPWGTRVVCIKSSKVENVILSLRSSLWTAVPPVVARILTLFEEVQRAGNGERLYLLFSVPGSKHFCGIAEMAGYLPNYITDFWAGGETFPDAIEVIWRFCKIVPYDAVKHVDEETNGDAVTQMWNGMAYSEPMGRAIVQAYVEAPHMQNLLAKPMEGYHFSDRSVFRRNNGSFTGHRNRRAITGPGEGRQTDPQHKASFKAHSTANQHARYGGRLRPDADGALPPPPTFNPAQLERESSEPKLQMVPAFVHPDGTITPLTTARNSQALVAPGSFSSEKTDPFENQLPRSYAGSMAGLTNPNAQAPRTSVYPHKTTWIHQGPGKGRIGPAKSSPSLRRPYRQENASSLGAPRVPPPPLKYQTGNTTPSGRFGPGPQPLGSPSVCARPRTETGGVSLTNTNIPTFSEGRRPGSSGGSPVTGIRKYQTAIDNNRNVMENLAQTNNQLAALRFTTEDTLSQRPGSFHASSPTIHSNPASGQSNHSNATHGQKGLPSHRARHTPATNSMDSGTNLWVDRLVASPDQDNAELAPGQGGVSLHSHLKDK